MTKTQATKLQDLFLQVSQIFGEIASESVDTGSKVETTVVTDGEAVKTDSVEVVEQEEEVTPSRFDELLTLKIGELRSMAKNLGLDTKGTKTDIANRIANAEQVELVYDEEPEAEVEVEVVEAEVVEDDTDEEIEQDLDEEDMEDEEELSDLELLKEELEGYTEEELREILEDVELSTKGKKQALISRILKAVEDGIIVYGDEDEEEAFVEDDFDAELEDAEVEEETEDDEDLEEDEEDEEEELSVREQVQEQISEQILEEYENGTLTDKQITKFLNEYSNGTFKTVNKKRSLNKYIEIMMELVDEDGEIVELGEPYYVGDDIAFCCGTQLKDVDGDFYCEVCGNEYEGE